ncbi:MAG: hypothetical protein HWQ38_20175 [Nostoc sp. NMS7]|uniref:hypothetical protein n=1 Tax=Nostoc sp. NMS7 TaxID=2815391 RepID=UPI0025CFA256|nr:hypothetical protein [Nostoc sp. NMS7]MBN3948645.1 hypothetical protein [Nostoc sp. NMS7]
MPNTSLREAAPTATLLRRRSVQVSTSAQCPIPDSHRACAKIKPNLRVKAKWGFYLSA